MLEKRLYFERNKKIPFFSQSRDKLEIKDKNLIHRLKNVLRKKENDKVVLFNGNGFDYFSEILAIKKDSIVFEILKKEAIINLLNKKVHVFLSCIRKNRFEVALEKLTEIGVINLTPIITDRTQVKFDKIQDRFLKIIIEASEQSGKASLLNLNNTLNFKDAFELAIKDNDYLNVLLDPSGENLNTFKNIANYDNFNLFIGPEGGFSELEIDLARQNKFLITKISQFTLRSETAAILAAGLILNL